MHPFSRTRRAIVAGTLALAAGTVAAAPAEAAAPTRIRDHTTSVSCQALNVTLTRFLVAESDLAGTEARAQISEDGVTLAEGQGLSDWTDTTFRASVQLEDATGGDLGTAGEAFLSGTYRATGEPVRDLNRFKDGNIRVVEDHHVDADRVRRRADGQRRAGSPTWSASARRSTGSCSCPRPRRTSCAVASSSRRLRHGEHGRPRPVRDHGRAVPVRRVRRHGRLVGHLG